MKRSELQKAIDDIKWFHRIALPYDEGGTLMTPGIVDYCTPEIASKRFGIPEDLCDKWILDVGAYDGYFSFLAAARGANVVAIDLMQPCSNQSHLSDGFLLARKALGGMEKVSFFRKDFVNYAGYVHEDFYPYDIVFYFGVLYHVDNPIEHLAALRDVTREYALIETAVFRPVWHDDDDVWKFKPGHAGDPTNKWYGTPKAILNACLHVGFRHAEVIFETPDKQRVTIKAYVK